ncbi:MAG: FliA/WhiG family RNA polymerase sigma factor [Chloroflexi bacterium]|nr:FliA/WhiG family RNA polymerase sigma factor [Chloroflexota bacterium]
MPQSSAKKIPRAIKKATGLAKKPKTGTPNGKRNDISDDLTEIVQDYMPLVRHAVNRITVGSSGAGILQYEDMLSYGMQGLIEAYHAFDPTRGAKFSTYALPRIRGAILDALRAAHPLPRSLQKFSSDLDQASAKLYVKLGRTPTRAELAKEMDLSQKDFLSTLRTSSIRVVSLEGLAETAVNGNTEKLMEMADDDRGVDPDSMAQDTMVRQLLHSAVDTLPDREKTIVQLYYMRAHSLKSIGQSLGISESRASQLRHRAIRRLRGALTDELREAA